MDKAREAGGGRREAGQVFGVWALLVIVASCGGNTSARDVRSDSIANERSPGGSVGRNPASRLHPPRGHPPASRKTILFVGTSITAGFGLEPDSAFPQLIDRKLDSLRLPYDAVNAGVSGETSAGLLRRIDWLLREPFDVVVVETGANDGLRGAPVATVRANIQQVVGRIRSSRP
ncbi:MAG: GDSL-type esterase/lipase family protein, partial [Gemmatimonadota bacterium]|nr:GDSL-type esterase/lipase family protein [Gemmatimonadota bacterium]